MIARGEPPQEEKMYFGGTDRTFQDLQAMHCDLLAPLLKAVVTVLGNASERG